MEDFLYNSIVATIRGHRGLSRDCLFLLESKFPEVNVDALDSILSHEYQKRMRMNHLKTPAVRAKYWNAYHQAVQDGDKPGIIVRMGVQFDVCPCLVAKLILERFMYETGVEEQPNVWLRDTALIPDQRLAYEIFLCSIYDNMYSPTLETIRHSRGQQFEIKLHNEVAKLGMAFHDEDRLRKYGYDKTPDIKLDVPVAVDGFVINWIESKALFGSEDVHEDYTKNQYQSYWNRFGPGLVIYWFGYARSILDPVEKRFIINSILPAAEIVQMSTSFIAK